MIAVTVIAGSVAAAIWFLERNEWNLSPAISTFLTGILAVLAATIAYTGVRHTQRVAIESTNRQLALQMHLALQQKEQSERQLEHVLKAEALKQRRENLYRLVDRATGHLVDLRGELTAANRLILESAGAVDRGNLDFRGRIQKIDQVRLRLIADGAAIATLGLDEVYSEIRTAAAMAEEFVLSDFSEPLNVMQFSNQWNTVHKCFSEAHAALQDGY